MRVPLTAHDTVDHDERTRILLVDDEAALLSSMRRQLTSRFIVETETDPVAALDRIGDLDGLAVVVSDMRMPGMDGATFLSHVCARWPDITRILLTGFAEVDSAIAAINHGRSSASCPSRSRRTCSVPASPMPSASTNSSGPSGNCWSRPCAAA
jgi:CheY-like chemotaxis protein